jgi:hypothetical protein
MPTFCEFDPNRTELPNEDERTNASNLVVAFTILFIPKKSASVSWIDAGDVEKERVSFPESPTRVALAARKADFEVKERMAIDVF